MNLGRAVGSTDSTDCADWKPAESDCRFISRATSKTDPDVCRVLVHLCNR